MKHRFIPLFLIALSLTACFGGTDKRGSVKHMSRDGIVTTESGRFRVGRLSEDWQRASFDYRAIYRQHRALNASVSISAFCKGAFDDGPLPILAKQLFYGLTEQQILAQNKLKLDGRDALRTVLRGKMDGAAAQIDSVVLKMNECVFDFTLVSQPQDYAKVLGDFEGFYRGFHYISGP